MRWERCVIVRTYSRSAMAVERTLILAKADAVVRRLGRRMLARFERRATSSSASS